jgi:hypothetical protein
MNETYSSWKNNSVLDSQMAMVYFINRFAIDHNDQQILKLLSQHSYEKILNTYQFKKIKGKAITCLRKWVAGDWNLYLSEKVYTPFEVLTFQAQGIRPVTMRYLETEIPILHRQNALDFFVHDLEHGYMFFNDEALMNMQKTFFARVEKSLATDLWKKQLENKAFREKFYYMISDMNSHMEHYKAYLRSIVSKEDYSQFEFLFL